MCVNNGDNICTCCLKITKFLNILKSYITNKKFNTKQYRRSTKLKKKSRRFNEEFDYYEILNY